MSTGPGEPLTVMPERYARVHNLVYNHRLELAAGLVATGQRALALELLTELGLDATEVADLERLATGALALAATGEPPPPLGRTPRAKGQS